MGLSGKEKNESGGGRSFGQAEYSAGIMHLRRGCEATDYLCKALKNFDGSLVAIRL